MEHDVTLHPILDKSDIIHLLENMVTVVLDVEPAIPRPNDDPDSSQHDDSDPTVACIIIRGMAVNHEHIGVKSPEQ